MNLRSRLVELLNTLDAILRNFEMDDALREQLLRQRALLSAMLDEVLRQAIDRNTAAYRTALERTHAATQVAKRALRELEDLDRVVRQIARAARATDQVIGLLSGASS